MTLRLWGNGHDFAIASSPAGAHSFLREYLGEGCGYDEPFDADEWSEWPADKPFTFVDTGSTPETSATKTAAEWCAERGPGYFASEDY